VQSVKPSDIAHLVSVSEPALSPDGTLVAYVVTRVDLDANRYRSAVWLALTDGSERPWQLTSGAESDAVPTWSPDSRRLAFTRTSANDRADRRTEAETTTLCVVPVSRSGETVVMATRTDGIGQPAWSPDGRHIAFAARVRADRYADGDDDRARPPRHVTRLSARLDSTGWTIDRPTQLFVVPADGGATPRRVTWDDVEYSDPAWAPDSRRLVTTAARHRDADLDTFNDIWVIDTTTSHDLDASGPAPEPQCLTGTDASYELPSWEPAGERVAALRTVAGVGYRHTQVAVVAPDGGAVTVLTAALDRGCAPYPGARAPVWRDGRLLFSVEDRGRVPLLDVAADGSDDPQPVIEGDRWISGFDAVGEVIAFVSTSSDAPTELFVARDGGEQQLSRHQEAFHTAAPSLAPERFTVTAADGTELDGWALLPPGFDPAGQFPALLNIHGGPHTQYGERWFDEFQLYASAGYVVLYANPRGSTGYSEASARVLLSPASTEDPGEGWGPPAFADLMLVVDTALTRYPAIDGSRLGVLGGSYGGYMTSWIVGHTDRFGAACSERAANNLPSLEWSSDAGGHFRYAMGVSLLDAPEVWAQQSPVSYVRDISTPVLIMHSEEDLRCPPEQADALWVAMRQLRKEVDYYRFPAESHELTRSGSPRHRIQRVELLLEWFGRRLDAATDGDRP